jgi:exosortase/archaeosortase family protein
MRKKLLLLIPFILVLCIIAIYFFNSLNAIAVHVVSYTGIYRIIEQVVIPLEVQSTLFMLRILDIKATGAGSVISVIHGSKWQDFIVTWNCTGWQSLVMLLISFITLIQFKGIFLKKAAIIFTGIIWMYFVNIIRITLQIGIFHKAGFAPAFVFHDYFAKTYLILMFCIFWIAVYNFVLKGEAQNISKQESAY